MVLLAGLYVQLEECAGNVAREGEFSWRFTRYIKIRTQILFMFSWIDLHVHGCVNTRS